MKKIVLVFLAAGAACAALGVILGKKYKIRFCDAEFDDEDSVDEATNPDINADAIMAVDTPVVEVHISNIFAREDFRQRHVTAVGARGFIAGFGVEGYALAIQSLLK